ncbi:putative P-type H(+)-exporting transporter [Helianthus annuus]|uniref:P-type H(+)-exporting transporter n=1 Tax=Helianthus annuus TaxID=4232 RepID=A0A9K3JVB9_HELAN|nr:putative P-type H(+)-exporting transporter [Helianthus annuus]KAJ0611569.1 putative P-type H(+)-exporting transporter [Helianthus annuus]KAJ0622623.1 putative P-type H(+)-exporting transporter [Helianthus annuus]KAJ0626871.1 putative P-type H(+)-exporting transporter [Helianthus annuus]KAJ0783206.1 putative P-type H(+)-exporting transporter [Helianthus annuus]
MICETEMMAALYLQVSIVSQALIFVTRSRSWSTRLLTDGCFPCSTTGNNFNCGIRRVGIRKNQRNRIEMGCRYLALQYRVLFQTLDIMKFTIRYIVARLGSA